MDKMNIALLAGGDSSERVVSVKSAAQVRESLDKDKYNVFLVDLAGSDWHYDSPDGRRWQVDKNDFSLTVDSTKHMLDYALILIHGTPGEDGKLQGYLEMMGIPFSSCGMVSSVITFDKLACKRAVAGTGINLAREIFIKKGDAVDAKKMVAELGLPMFIKPNASGSSFGVTKVKKEEDILQAVENAFLESDAVLAEEFIEGREMGCGILITKEKEYILPVTEIISKKDFFDFEAKYTPGASEEITPADIDAATLKQLNDMTRAAYIACGCRGVVRIDFIVRADGTPYMIEVNSVPGMSGGSIVPQQAAHAGMTLGQLFDIVIRDTYFKRK